MKYYHLEVSETGRYAFIPAEYGRYIRTHVAALFVPCPHKLCRAKKKTPCISLKKLASFDTRVPQVAIHAERLAAYHAYQAGLPAVDAGGKVIPLKGRKHG